MKKTIIYVIIVLMLGSMFASALPFSGKNNSNEIVLQCIGQEASETLLIQSAEIMKSRLKAIGIKHTDIRVSADSATLGISFKEMTDLTNASWFLSTKGELGFYETVSKQEVIGLLTELENQDLVDQGIHFVWGAFPDKEGRKQLHILKGNPALDGNCIEKAIVVNEKRTGGTSVMIDLDQSGSLKFQELTKRSISRPVAIVLDNIVYSAPVVQEAISGGKCMISGKFSNNEAAQLAAIIDSGELPLDFKILK